MSDDNIQYITQQKLDQLKTELETLQQKKIPALAQRIDEARQLGDLSENAEYHTAREEMAWAQSRVRELFIILQQAQVIHEKHGDGVVGIGSRLIVDVKGKKKEYTIVGAQDANPLGGLISNESPLGAAFLGRKKGDQVEVRVPSGIQVYQILDILS